MRIEEVYNHKHKLSGTPLALRSIYIIPALILLLFSKSFIFNIFTILLFFLLTRLITKISLKHTLKLYTYPILFIVIGCFTIAFTMNSSSPFFEDSKWNFGFDNENIMLAFEILSRSIAIVCVVFLGLLTHTISEISAIMRFLRIPPLFVEIFVLTYKFIFSLSSVSNIMYTAQLSREGYLTKRNYIKAFTMLSSAILRRAFQQSNYLAIAIECRLGNGSFYFLSQKGNYKAKQLLVPFTLLLLLLVSFIIFNAHG